MRYRSRIGGAEEV